jgi:hypothetical protein
MAYIPLACILVKGKKENNFLENTFGWKRDDTTYESHFLLIKTSVVKVENKKIGCDGVGIFLEGTPNFEILIYCHTNLD